MSKVAISGNASGTGVFTLAAPNSNIDRVLTLPDEAGTVLTTAGSLPAANLTGSVPASAMPAGSVLQVVRAEYNTQVAFSSTSWQSLFSASITPTSTSSKIFVIATAAFSGKGSFTVYRGGSDLLPGQLTYAVYASSIAGQNNWNNGSIRNPLMLSTFDLPNSTASTTYTVYGRSYSTNASDNGGINEGGGSYKGTSLVLMEIAG